MSTYIKYLSFVFLITSCASLPKGDPISSTAATDYTKLSNWAAHPHKKDKADMVPEGLTKVSEDDLSVDVFFVHPTTYTKKAINDSWNAPTTDLKLNEKTDNTTIQYQASIFNQAGRMYAPRYRQAHISAYFTEDDDKAKKVFDIAYSDVKKAFDYYIKNYNQGRPFIIASHSQGTTHCGRLIKEVVDGSQLENQLVAAYLIGMPVPKDIFKSIQPCISSDDTGCFVSWRTYKNGHNPEDVVRGEQITVHNPLTWTMDSSHADKSQNKGAIIRNFDKLINNATDAKVENGILWAAKPKFALSFLFTAKNYHIADLNFYYVNVRENAVERANAFLKR